MRKRNAIIVIAVIIGAFCAGLYFRDDVIKFYNGFNKQVGSFQQTQFGQTIAQVGKEILSPPPLTIGGAGNQAVLLQSKIILETNLQRQENGNLPALIENTKLDNTAEAKAEDILKNQYFEHISPSGVGPGQLAQRYGYDYIVEGENLILGNFSSEKEVVQDWMNSPGHRANILNTRYVDIGVAIVKGTYKGQTSWVGVQEFGLPVSACAQPNSALKSQIDAEKSQLEAMSAQIDAAKNQINSTDQGSPAYEQMVNDYNQTVVQYNALADQIKQEIANYNLEVNHFNNCVAGT